MSFVQNGYRVELYRYGHIDGVPDGVKQRDAQRIVAQERIFRYPAGGFGAGSVAGFADLFRYKLLADRGGWWFDTDLICLRRIEWRSPYFFAREDDTKINNALMRAPKGSPLMKLLYERALARVAQPTWGETGPVLVTAVVTGSAFERFVVPRERVYPLHYTEAAAAFGDDPHERCWRQLDGADTVHLWNQILEAEGIDKDARFPATSVYARLQRAYGTH
jgi:hypothetical protein